MKRLSLLIAVALFAATSLFAQSKLSNHSRFLINNANKNVKMQADFGIKSVNGVQMVSAFVTFNDAIDASLIAKYGGTVQSEFPANKVVTALLPLAALEALSREEEILYIEVAEKVKPKMDIARTASNAERMINGQELLSQSYLGRGVIVGIIDNGFQLDHPNFWNASHDRYRIKAFWDQNTGEKLMDSASILNEKYDYEALVKKGTHATHVLGIAAGADHSKNYYGIAQEADIVAVSTDGDNSHIADAARWIMDYANDHNKPCVINISMGSNLGSHDGLSTECKVIDSLSRSGRIIVCAAGNEADINLHLQNSFATSDTLRTMLNIDNVEKVSIVDVWGEAGKTFNSQFVVMDTNADTLFGQTVFLTSADFQEIDFNVMQGADTLFQVAVVGSVTSLNKGNITWYVIPKVRKSNLVPGIVVAADSGIVNMWCNDETSFVDKGVAGWTGGDNNMTIDDLAVSKKAIAVGAYNTRVTGTSLTAGDITYYSSLGPTVDGRTKPEITAPGYKIMSSVSDIATADQNESTVVGGKTYYYGLIDGTSMATPYVTGVIAAWLEADSTLDYDGIVDIFRRSAIRDEYTGTNLPDNTWGYGKMNAYQGILYALGLTAGVNSVTDHQIVGIYPNPTADEFRVGFASADNNVTVTVLDLSGRAILSRTLGNVSPGQECSFSLSDAPTGIYMVRISGSNHSNTYKLVKN